jgi:hypothetical protein
MAPTVVARRRIPVKSWVLEKAGMDDAVIRVVLVVLLVRRRGAMVN